MARVSSAVAYILAEVKVLDPELLQRSDTRLLVTLGAQLANEVTKKHGTPSAAKWASGSYETDVLMSFHNGGEDGHTSVGPKGVGVPRNTLVIAKAVNKAAGREVYSPLMRATAFYAACVHDNYQLCGRSLLPAESRGSGDERLSAKEAQNRCLTAGGGLEAAKQANANIMATAFHPHTGAQNVQRPAGWKNTKDSNVIDAILGQELTAAADLHSPASKRGVLGAIEHTVEILCFRRNGRIIQEQLHRENIALASITTTEQLLSAIAESDILSRAFTDMLAGQPAFFAEQLRYSDEAIRAACGKGIDDLFPLRLKNAAVLAEYTTALRAGKHPLVIWQQARKRAGY